MYEELEKAIGELKNTSAGWVTRRDAADILGVYARRALAALQQHADEADRDVRAAVEKALARVPAPEAPAAPALADQEYALQDLVAACHKPPKRIVSPDGGGYVVDVQCNGGRQQRVHVLPYTRKDSHHLLRIYTYCGELREDLQTWFLKSNAKLAHCAFAIFKEEGGERVVLVNNFVRSRATPQTVKAAVKEVAFYGDWLENKMTGQDEF